jgi:hypothetical protein
VSALVYLVLAGAAALLVERFGHTGVPGSRLAAALAGIVGSVLLALPLGDQGPHLLGVAVLPAAGGAILGALLLRLALTRTTIASQ